MTTTTVEKILSDFEIAAAVVAEIGPIAAPGVGTAIGAGAVLAGKLLAAIQAGVRAHEAITGTPLDMSKLHDIQPV